MDTWCEKIRITLIDKLIGEIEEKYEDAQDKNEIYNALVALEKIRDFPFNEVFTDNGYVLDDESIEYLKGLAAFTRLRFGARYPAFLLG